MSIFDLAKSTISRAIGSNQPNLLFSIGQPVQQQDLNSIWTVHSGTKKDDNQPVTVFIFETRKFPSKVNLAKNALKRYKTIRYPDCLKFIDGAETESQVIIGTEFVEPLSQKMQDIDQNLVRLGLFKIASTLKFLAEDCDLIHGFVTPESIFVTKSGEWKLGGFDTLSSLKEGPPLILSSDIIKGGRLVPPEFGDSLKDPWDIFKEIPNYAFDSWSFGHLIYVIYNGPMTTYSDLTSRAKIPTPLFRYYKDLISNSPNTRSNFTKFLQGTSQKGGYFDNEFVASSQFLENFALKEKHEKEGYLISIENEVEKFPIEFSKYKILPELINSLEFGGAGAKALKPILTIGSRLEFKEFEQLLLPTIVKLFNSNDRLLRLALLEKMPLYVEHLSSQVANDSIFSNLTSGFADNTPIIREQTLKAVTILAPKLNAKTINDPLLRHLAKLQTDPEPGIRTNTTICLVKLCKYFDENVKGKVLLQAFLRSIKDPFPPARKAGLMGLVATMTSFNPTDIAKKLMPNVCPLLVDPEKSIREQAFATIDGFQKLLLDHSSKMPDRPEAPPSQETNPADSKEGWASWAISSVISKTDDSKKETNSPAQPKSSLDSNQSRPSSGTAPKPAIPIQEKPKPFVPTTTFTPTFNSKPQVPANTNSLNKFAPQVEIKKSVVEKNDWQDDGWGEDWDDEPQPKEQNDWGNNDWNDDWASGPKKVIGKEQRDLDRQRRKEARGQRNK
ncbi:hypothetical protein HDV04_000513 [Boothiomyces sp. JEL0838]|nr:hypothetical protein HDV04_000513 [Boothiomyces sp. JEL0838]